jgi:two-component system NarL family response regulator
MERKKQDVRVVIADNHRLVLEALQSWFKRFPDFEISGVTHEPARVLALVREVRPDLLLLDAEMGGIEMGMFLLRRVRAAHPAVDVVLLSESLDPERASTAMVTHGAKGIIEKSAVFEALAPALRAAIRGEGPVVGRPTLQRPAHVLGLTEREESVLLALARGRSNKQIACELWMAPATVQRHLSRAYTKLGVNTRIEALRVLMENAILGDNPYNWL